MKTTLLNQIIVLLERLDASLIVRDPGNSRSAEAFDGLRKSILQSSKNRRMHVSHLLSLSDSIERGADYQLVKDRVSDYMLELGISKSSDLSNPDFFEITGGEGEYLRCEVPAVIETLDDGSVSLVRLGEAVRTTEASVHAVRLPDPRVDGEAEVSTTSGMKVAIGITLAIVGFFFGWVIATTAQSESSEQLGTNTHTFVIGSENSSVRGLNG